MHHLEDYLESLLSTRGGLGSENTFNVGLFPVDPFPFDRVTGGSGNENRVVSSINILFLHLKTSCGNEGVSGNELVFGDEINSVIEYLPAELKSRFLEMKELDERVQSQLESLNDRTKTFFTLCRKNKSDWREQQYQSLCQEYEKVTREAAEKVNLANQVYELLDRHLRRLDNDLSRFTIELEADTAGITEILEQKSYVLDRPPTPERPQTAQKRTRHAIQHDDLPNGDFDDYSPSHSTRSSPVPSSRLKYPRRERASMFNLAPEVDSDFLADLDEQLTSPSNFYAGTGGKPPISFTTTTTPEPKSHKKRSLQQPIVVLETVQENPDWLGYVDCNEPTYCLCNQVSYGEMVACDNPECPIEWFHYGCVGITDPPKGKWYCPQCTLIIKKRKK